MFLGPSLNSDRTIKLFFNIAAVKKTEKVFRAELRMFKLKRRGLSICSSKEEDKNQFRNIELLDLGTNKVITGMLIWKRGFGWKTFDITNAVLRWVSKPNSNKGIQLRLANLEKINDEECFAFSTNQHKRKEPILIVYSEEPQKKEDIISGVGPLGNDLPEKQKKRPSRDLGDSSCNRKDLIVDIEKINWHKWILYPKRFNIYRCEGHCQLKKHNGKATNHGIVQAALHELEQSNLKVQSPCCAPLKLESKVMMLYEMTGGSTVVKIQYLKNMVVNICACL